MNSLCYKCHVAGCTYTYLSDACAAARKEECPDIVYTNEDKIRDMDTDELADVLMCPMELIGVACTQKRSCIECTKKWLLQSAEDNT